MLLRLPIGNKKWLIAFLLPVFIVVATAIFILTAPRPPLLDNIPFSTAYYDRNGTLLRLSLAKDDKYRLFTPLAGVSTDLIAATLTQEDRHFYKHPGVNPASILRAAFETYIMRTRPIGGSTITMQVVRLRDDLGTRGIGGKITQIIRALILERYYSKDEILEAYLNLAPYGGNIHGAGTASLIYFGQAARNLALPQSLGLAVIPQNPVRRFPLNHDGSAWQAARKRLFTQLPADYKTQQQSVDLPMTVSNRDDLPFLAPHFINGLDHPLTGSVDTTLDLNLQRTIQQTVGAWLAQKKSLGLDNAAIMLVDTTNMEVRALIGSGDFFDVPTQGQVDGTAAMRSPGSTLKPFVYGLALEQGLIHPETLLADDPAYFSEYRPGNFDDRFMGQIPAREALALSRNVPAIALAAQLKSPNLYEFLQTGGMNLPRDQSHYGLSMVVGGAEVDMRTLVKLYAMLANGGQLRDLKFIRDGNTQMPRQMLSAEAALLTLTMLERPDPDLPPFTTAKLPVYWKTGTSSSYRDAWTVGVFGPYVLAVWTGHFDGRPSPALVGTEAAAPLFFNIVNAIEQQEDLRDMIHPAMAPLNLARVSMNDDTTPGWFIPGKSPFAPISKLNEKPDILTPRNGVAYVANDRSGNALRIPLEAKSNVKQRPLYWFANNELIGVANDNAPLFWSPTPGRYTIRTVDSQGHSASTRVNIVAE